LRPPPADTSRWFLYPPHALARPPSMPMPRWIDEYDRAAAAAAAATGGRGAGQAMGSARSVNGGMMAQCVQEAGDVLFVPSGWHHAVLNLQESVAIAIELGENRQLFDAMLRVTDVSDSQSRQSILNATRDHP
jgi:hypothetical protein